MKSLAVQYRPHTFSEVVEQDGTKAILQNQLETGEIKGSYIFVGAAGTGKTTCARIFAKDINHGDGNPIEMDAASHNGVDDVREIAKMAQTRSLDSEYKCFIIDECHLFSNGAWGAMLKLIEEPPAKSVFILCTTDYWKIPKTIQSRCQRFTFKRISVPGIYNRLQDILSTEHTKRDWEDSAVDFIAKQADGCLRDAVTMLDKCLAYNTELTMDNVIKALELSDYTVFMELTDAIDSVDYDRIIQFISSVYDSGQDMKQFIRQYLNFILDVSKYMMCGNDFTHTQLPETDDMKNWLNQWDGSVLNELFVPLVKKLIDVDNSIKYSQSPRQYIEASLLTF